MGGWGTFVPGATNLEDQGIQLEHQPESRERFVKEVAKRASISSFYNREWIFSHQTKGDMLSPMTVVSITQPWQRNKLLDFTRNNSNRQRLQEKFYIKDQAEDNWEKILKTFGKYQDKGQNMKEI